MTVTRKQLLTNVNYYHVRGLMTKSFQLRDSMLTVENVFPPLKLSMMGKDRQS